MFWDEQCILWSQNGGIRQLGQPRTLRPGAAAAECTRRRRRQCGTGVPRRTVLAAGGGCACRLHMVPHLDTGPSPAVKKRVHAGRVSPSGRFGRVPQPWVQSGTARPREPASAGQDPAGSITPFGGPCQARLSRTADFTAATGALTRVTARTGTFCAAGTHCTGVRPLCRIPCLCCKGGRPASKSRPAPTGRQS